MNNNINSIIENLYDAAILHDISGNIIDVNKLMLNLFAIDKQKFLSYSIKDIFYSEFTYDAMFRLWGEVNWKKHHVFELKARNPVTSAMFDVEVDLRIVNWTGENMILGSIRDISRRKKIENDLRENENKFKILFENAAIPQLLIEGSTFIDCNKKALRMIGFPSKEHIIGLTPADISPNDQPDGNPSCMKAEQLLSRSRMGSSIEFEWVHKKQSGEEIYSIVILTPFIIQGKTIIHTAWIDITKRKKAEKTLIESQKKYKSIFEGTNEAVILLAENRIIDCNQRTLEMFGCTDKTEVISLHPADISPVIQLGGFQSYTAAKRHMEMAYREGTARFEWTHKKADGEIFPAEVVLSSFDLNGVFMLQGAIRDITERKKAIKALHESEERYRNLSDITFEGILMHENGIAIDVNLSFCKMYDYSREELIGKNVINLIIDEEYQPLAYHKIQTHDTQPYEVLCRKKDGTIIWQEVVGKPLVYNGKNIRVTAIRDISDRKNLEQEIIRASELERQRIGQDLHDGLGQTLTGISIMLGTIARKVQLDKQVKQDEIMLIAKQVEEAIETTRQTARGLYPVTLEKGGLISALREMASIVENNYGIQCLVNHSGLDTCKDIRISSQIYYITFEAVNNAIRHSYVKNIVIDSIINEKKLIIIIENVGEIKSKEKNNDGMGMKIMQYRANMIGASLTADYIKQGYRIELVVNYD